MQLKEIKSEKLTQGMPLLIVQTLDGADVGANDGKLRRGIHGAPPEEGLPHARLLVIEEV